MHFVVNHSWIMSPQQQSGTLKHFGRSPLPVCCTQSQMSTAITPVCSSALIFYFCTPVKQTPLKPSPSISLFTHLSISRNKVSLWDDTLDFVIRRVGCSFIVADGDFVSVSLRKRAGENTEGYGLILLMKTKG